MFISFLLSKALPLILKVIVGPLTYHLGRVLLNAWRAIDDLNPTAKRIAVFGLALLISGVVVTETVYAIPGIGRLTVDAILRRDYPIIQGVVLIFSEISSRSWNFFSTVSSAELATSFVSSMRRSSSGRGRGRAPSRTSKCRSWSGAD